MKRVVLFLIISFSHFLILQSVAQDDMYFVPKKSKKTKTTKVVNQKSETLVDYTNTDTEYYSGNLRDVDEYNRRGGSSRNLLVMTPTDTFEIDGDDLQKDDKGNYILGSGNNKSKKSARYDDRYDDYYLDDYIYSARLARFHGFVYPYYAWYDPFYYDPFYYTSWYYDPWYYGTYWGWYGGWHGYYGWHSPWYYSSWHHHPVYTTHTGGYTHRGFNGGRGYGRTGVSSRGGTVASRGGSTTRLAGNSLQNRSTSRGYTIGGRGTGTQSSRGYNTSSLRGTVNNGSSRGISSSSSRSTVTNTVRSTSSSRGSYSGSSRGSSYSGGSSRSGGFSGGGSSRGGGGFSGGSRSGGGFSGGGSSRGGGRR